MVDPDVFDSALGDRFAWWSTARTLREAAEAVYGSLPPHDFAPSPSLPPGYVQVNSVSTLRNAYVFLAALSLETLLKGEIVRTTPNAVAGGKLGEILKDRHAHNLATLADRANFTVSADELALLSDATNACISWGRYPGGVSHNKGDIAPPDGFNPAAFKRIFEPLFDRLEAQVMQGIDDSWANELPR
jgi:hypothetical protein